MARSASASSWSRAVVAAVVDEFLGGGEVGLRRFTRVRFLAEEEAGTVEVDVGQVQPHRAALGDVAGFVQAGPRASNCLKKKMATIMFNV